MSKRAHGRGFTPSFPGFEKPAHQEGRTYFPRSVKQVGDVTNLLVSGVNNAKIGRVVTVGRFKGWEIYTLSLEERKTCPRACHHWQNCYGNSMPYAKRIDHTSPDFLPALEANIERLLALPGPPGVLVRLHALGDFYSSEYVNFWCRMLATHKRLMIFGYTAWLSGTVSA